MKAEIVSVGTELLLGDIVNSDAQFISRELAELGIDIYYQTVVGDNQKRLKSCLETSFSRSDIVITTGGLGPTEDDLTKETGCAVLGKKLINDSRALDEMTEFFKSVGRPMSENNLKQALVPEGGKVLYNENGTAPGIIAEESGKVLIMLPGPPNELNPMFEKYVIPFLRSRQEYVLVSRVLRVVKLGESMTEYMIRDLIDTQTNPTIATYAKDFEVIVKVTAKAKSTDECEKLIDPVANEIKKRFGHDLYAEGDTNVIEYTCKKLLEKKLTVAAAESCTGGLVSKVFTDMPGISDIFVEGAVTYCNDAKMRRLGVKKETLDKFTAVSAQTAYEMAEGIAKTANTEIGLSTTGIAGPGGGTEEQPVGLVYIGIHIKGKTITKELHLNGNRDRIRKRAVNSLFDALRRELEKENIF